MIGDSVIWGEYVAPEGTWSSALTRGIGKTNGMRTYVRVQRTADTRIDLEKALSAWACSAGASRCSPWRSPEHGSSPHASRARWPR